MVSFTHPVEDVRFYITKNAFGVVKSDTTVEEYYNEIKKQAMAFFEADYRDTTAYTIINAEF